MATRVIEIEPDVICVRRSSYYNCSYLVRTTTGIVVIDAGMKEDGRDVTIGLRHFGETVDSISTILLTHWHNDHSAGAARMQSLSGAPVYYNSVEAPYFTGQRGSRGVQGKISDLIPEVGPLVLLKGLLGEAAPHPVEAGKMVADGERIAGEFIAIESPGHTPGHLSYFHEPTATLFAGDALAVIDQQLRFMARPVTPDLDAARDSMKKILQHQTGHICPGHREPLIQNVEREIERMKRRLDQNEWPLFG